MYSRLILFCFFIVFAHQFPTRSGQGQCCWRKGFLDQNSLREYSNLKVLPSKGQVNWDYKNFYRATNEITVKPIVPMSVKRCPDRWLRFRESCYYIERKRMDMTGAEKNCHDKGATLFLANSPEEFEVVMRSAPLNFWTWIGMVQFNFMQRPIWQVYGGIQPAKLKWLVSPFTSASNGWSSASECVAYYNSELKIASYNYFYPCQLGFNSICERNITLINSSSPR